MAARADARCVCHEGPDVFCAAHGMTRREADAVIAAAPDARRERAGEMRQTLAALIHWYDNANTDGRLLGEIIYNARALLASPPPQEAP